MIRQQHIAPNTSNVTAHYRTPFIDQLLGRTTLEWMTDAGNKDSLRASLRFTDYEGHLPSAYSLLRLPYVIKTWWSTRNSPILDKPVPFIVLDAIRFLEKIIQPGMTVVEAGGGNSTLWFLERGARVTTYEHSADWACYVQCTIHQHPMRFHETNSHMKVMQGNEAISDMALIPDHSIDIALIDCMNDYTRRNDCIRVLMNKVKPGGWVILDNSDNPVNWIGASLLQDREMIRFSGYAPMGLFVCQTTFWKM